MFGVHWDAGLMRPWRGLMVGSVPLEMHFMGISERTALIGGADAWEVRGRGTVDHRFQGRREELREGELARSE